MPKQDTLDEADSFTEPEDWVGAAEVRPSERPRAVGGDAMMFHVYRASNDQSLFAVIDSADETKLPPCPGGRWTPFKRFPELGRPRIGFSEEAALSDIRDHGYHLNRIDIVSEVSPAPSSDLK